MRYELVCVHPFANFKRGDVITDPVEVAKYIDGPKAHHFVKRPAAEQLN